MHWTVQQHIYLVENNKIINAVTITITITITTSTMLVYLESFQVCSNSALTPSDIGHVDAADIRQNAQVVDTWVTAVMAVVHKRGLRGDENISRR